MKASNKIAFVVLGTLLLCTSCETNIPQEKRDWDGTTDQYASKDEKMSSTYYKPYAGFVGDPMPFYDENSRSFKVLYLQDFRPNMAGTFHPIWGVETTDAANYTSLNEVLPTGAREEQDAAIGTGCVVYNPEDKLYYIFYTGNKNQPKAGEDAQVVMRATSPDFKTWTKDPLFRLRGGKYAYSTAEFRDPCIFRCDEDELWHMVISTKVGGKGNLAEFTSPDLKTWEHKGIFMPMMWDRFYECPDVFKMGDYWYLVYSEISKGKGKEWGRHVQYFKGATLADLKACTAADAGKWPDGHDGFLDSRGLYAGKTAYDGKNRYLWGWCPTREGNDNTKTNPEDEPQWAGSLVAHRLIQHEDGSLTLGEVPGIAAKYAKKEEVKMMEHDPNCTVRSHTDFDINGAGYALFRRLDYHNHIAMTVTTETASDKFGISFVRGRDSINYVYYTLVVNPESTTKRKINFEQEGKGGKGFIPAIDSYIFDTPSDNIYHIDIYTDNSVLVLYINDVLAYTNRVHGIQHNYWSVNAYTGKIQVKDLQITTY